MPSDAPVQLILDTDIDTDCDDAGALAVLHALANRGEVQLLGVVCSVPVPWTALCAAAINEACGRSDVPVGLLELPNEERETLYGRYLHHRGRSGDGTVKPLYNEVIGREWQEANPDWRPREAVSLYRDLLSRAPEVSVTLCAIGGLSALGRLLDSGPDEYSPMTGEDLVRAKVKRLVTMAESVYPSGADSFNWTLDRLASARVINGWPAPITVSDAGRNVLTGPRFLQAAPESHPVARALRIWFGDREPARSSWDQLAAIVAVRGGAGLFAEHGGNGLRFDAATGTHEYIPLEPGKPERTWLEPLVDDAAMARAVEDLMIEVVSPPR